MAVRKGSTKPKAPAVPTEDTPFKAVAGYLIPRLWNVINLIEVIDDLNREEDGGEPKDFRIRTLCELGAVMAGECVQLVTNANEAEAIAILGALESTSTPAERISAALKGVAHG